MVGTPRTLVAAPLAVGAAAGGAIGIAGFRAVYRSTKRQGETALERLLQATANEAGATP